jgi:hypothetical protein
MTSIQSGERAFSQKHPISGRRHDRDNGTDAMEFFLATGDRDYFWKPGGKEKIKSSKQKRSEHRLFNLERVNRTLLDALIPCNPASYARRKVYVNRSPPTTPKPSQVVLDKIGRSLNVRSAYLISSGYVTRSESCDCGP